MHICFMSTITTGEEEWKGIGEEEWKGIKEEKK